MVYLEASTHSDHDPLGRGRRRGREEGEEGKGKRGRGREEGEEGKGKRGRGRGKGRTRSHSCGLV